MPGALKLLLEVGKSLPADWQRPRTLPLTLATGSVHSNRHKDRVRRGLRRMMETSGDLMFAIEAAAPYELVAADAREEGMVIHRAGWGMAIQRLEALGALKQELDPAKATDMLAFLSLPATWRTLRQLYGWTYDEIEAWMVETALTLVTEPSPAPRAHARPAGNRSPA